MDPILDGFASFASTLSYGDLPSNAVTASKERLLDVMAGAPDYETLKTLTQAQLASIHAERMTNAALWSEGDQSRTHGRPRGGDSFPVDPERR